MFDVTTYYCPGCHHGTANRLVAEVLEEFPSAVPTRPTQACEEPARRASALLDALGFDPLGLDALQARTGLDTASLQVLLLELELEGEVARLPGGLFQRLVRA